MNRYLAICLVVSGILAGCAKHQDAVPFPPPRAEAEAGVIVTNLARQKGIRLEDYQVPTVRFDAARREWHFSYEFKPPGMPGGHFVIIVDENGNARHIGGA